MIKLNSGNYSIWKPIMEDILYCKDLYAPIQGNVAKLSTTIDDAWNILHRKCISVIRQWVNQSVFHHISRETVADVLWNKLGSMYERQTTLNKAYLVKKLVNMKYKDGHNVSEHLSDFQGVINQLTTLKMVLEDEL